MIFCATNFAKTMEICVMDSCVYGFHVYKDIWTSTTGRARKCIGFICGGHQERDQNNLQKISAVCFLFVQRMGSSPVDLQKCCSEDDLLTAPWRFLLSFLPFLVLLYSFSKVQISPKQEIRRVLMAAVYNSAGCYYLYCVKFLELYT